MSQAEAIARAEALTGHVFANPALLREALTHRSAASGRRRKGAGLSNERLEFLGDRVLGLVIAEWLAERFPAEPEGALGPRLAALVSRDALAEIGSAIGLPALLAIGAGEANSGLELRANVVADALEAVIGAVYLDGGLAPARDFIHARWQDAVTRQLAPPQDPKTALQEFLLARAQGLPEYVLHSTQGPPHAPQFVVIARALGKQAEGTGSSKRAAERQAAAALLSLLT